MYKIFLIAVSLMFLASCEYGKEIEIRPPRRDIEKVCIENVIYYEVSSYHSIAVTPAFRPDGTLRTCRKEGDKFVEETQIRKSKRKYTKEDSIVGDEYEL